jgi:hypothetical protein
MFTNLQPTNANNHASKSVKSVCQSFNVDFSPLLQGKMQASLREVLIE